jgi:flagellar basal body-associated protein FliL
MNKKLIATALALTASGGGAYAAMRPGEAPPEPKVHGHVYVLPKAFLINLADERLLQVTVGLLVDAEKTASAHGGGEGAAPPEGFGDDPQEALVREIVVDELTGQPARRFEVAAGRQRYKERILRALRQHTDVPATHVLFTDLTIQ